MAWITFWLLAWWQSTGSFFPDRSTTLGTLMGVSAFGGAQAQQQRRAARVPAAGEEDAGGGAQRALREEEEEAPVPARPQPGRQLVAAVPGPRRRRAADVAGRVPGHGAAARGGRLPLRRHRRLGE